MGAGVAVLAFLVLYLPLSYLLWLRIPTILSELESKKFSRITCGLVRIAKLITDLTCPIVWDHPHKSIQSVLIAVLVCRIQPFPINI